MGEDKIAKTSFQVVQIAQTPAVSLRPRSFARIEERSSFLAKLDAAGRPRSFARNEERSSILAKLEMRSAPSCTLYTVHCTVYSLQRTEPVQRCSAVQCSVVRRWDGEHWVWHPSPSLPAKDSLGEGRRGPKSGDGRWHYACLI